MNMKRMVSVIVTAMLVAGTVSFADPLKGARYIVSDSAWSPDGKSICACVAWVEGRKHGVKLVHIELY